MNQILEVAGPFDAAVVRIECVQIRVAHGGDIDSAIGSNGRRSKNRAADAGGTLRPECPQLTAIPTECIERALARADINGVAVR
jgi:hypothetical protein